MKRKRKIMVILVITAAGVLSGYAQGQVAIIEGPVISPVNGNTYYLLEASTWTEAETTAVAMGGHLATVRSEAENNWIYDTFAGKVQSGVLGLWIGLNDIAEEGNFVWSSGEPVTYTNWDAGQPDNMDGTENCAHIWLDPVRELYKWNDYHDDPWHFAVSGVVEVLSGTILVSLEITGPDEVPENSSGQYTALAYYDGGAGVDVTSWADWLVEPDTDASIDDSGMLTTEDIDKEQSVTVRASFTSGDVTVEAEKDVYIFAICPDGTALEFDGVDDYVDLPDGFADFTDGFTVALWTYPGHTGWHERFIDFGNGSGSDNIILTRVQTTNHLILSVWSGGSQGAWVYAHDVLELNKWQHFAATVDSGGNAVIYKNGSVVGTGRTAAPRNITRVNNYIGKSNWGVDAYYKGGIDDVRIYGRVLSDNEIKAAMHIPLEGGEPNLVGYWNFDEGEGQIAGDLSGNGNDGTLGSTSGIDDSDPMWVESDAPVGICSPYLIAKIALRRALQRKAAALGEVSAALEQEAVCLDALDELLASGDYGDLKKGDIVKASQRTHSAMQHEQQSADALEKSIEKLEDASAALGVDE